MDKFTILLELLKDYDVVSLAVIGIGYLAIHKKINIVDNAVNKRPAGSSTISEDVIIIKNEIKLMSADLTHVKAEVDAHEIEVLRTFLRIEKDIGLINDKI